jgi:hypothetical protein
VYYCWLKALLSNAVCAFEKGKTKSARNGRIMKSFPNETENYVRHGNVGRLNGKSLDSKEVKE